MKKYFCFECYQKEHCVKLDKKTELSYEEFLCCRCGECKNIVLKPVVEVFYN